MSETGPVMLYDGVCALCTSATQFVLKRDKGGHFRFAALQGELAKSVLSRHGKQIDALDTFYLVLHLNTDREQMLERSTAALHVLRRLPWPWPMWFPFIIVPRWLRDAVYNGVARYRYRVFGKHELCMLPAPEWRERFLD